MFKKMIRFLDFFTPKARLTFTKLSLVFVKALIVYHLNLKHYIRIEIDTSSYAISKIFNQLSLDNLSLLALFS